MKQLFACLLLTYNCVAQTMSNTTLTHYAIGAHRTNTHPILILSTNSGPAAIAQQHTFALRTFLNYLTLGKHPIDMIAEELGAPSSDRDIDYYPVYKMYLDQKQMGTLRYASHDCRDQNDAEVITLLATVLNEITDFANQDSTNQWPEKSFFASPSYMIIKNNLRETTSTFHVTDLLEHLDEQTQILNNPEHLLFIPTDIKQEIIVQFVRSKEKIEKLIAPHLVSDRTLLIDIIFDYIEHNPLSQQFRDLSDALSAPSTLMAQASFLDGIIESQSNQNMTLFFANENQTTPIIAYLKRIGYQFDISLPLINIIGNKINTIDMWSCINLLLHSFATDKEIKNQQTLLDVLSQQHTKRVPINVLHQTCLLQ